MEELYHSYEGSALLGGAKKKLKLNMKKKTAHAVRSTHYTKKHVKRAYVSKKSHSSLLRYERIKASVGLSPIQEKRYRELKHAHGGAMLGGEMLGGEMLGGEMLGGAKLIGLAQQHAGALLGGDGGALLGGKKGKRLAPIKLRYRKFPSPKEYKAKYSRKPRAVKPASPAQRAARAKFSEATALVRCGVPRAEAFRRVFGTSRKAPAVRPRVAPAVRAPAVRPRVARVPSEAQMLRTRHSEIARNARRPSYDATYSIEKQREALRPRFDPMRLEEVVRADLPPSYFQEDLPPYTLEDVQMMAAGYKKKHKKRVVKKHRRAC
jgi:hypothetical protein